METCRAIVTYILDKVKRDAIIKWPKVLRLIHGKHWSIDHAKVKGDFKTIFEIDERGRIKEHVGVVVIDEGLDE